MKNHAHYKHKTARKLKKSEIQKRSDTKIKIFSRNKNETNIKTKNR